MSPVHHLSYVDVVHHYKQLTGTVVKANLTLMAVFKIVKQPYMRDLANVQNLTYAPFFAATEVSCCYQVVAG